MNMGFNQKHNQTPQFPMQMPQNQKKYKQQIP